MTAKQLAKRTELSIDKVSRALATLRQKQLATCLTPTKPRARIHWFTHSGINAASILRAEAGLEQLRALSNMDWDLYSDACHSHRTAVLLALEKPMQAAAVKRKARFQNSSLRMSANNARDVLNYFEHMGIVRRVFVRKSMHPHFELTELGDGLRVHLAASR
ncbi:MAG: hypothetical protein A49_11750 [Methyloceanibacter sp.]|nr:MAG: hypothetical protein A49_11750 [Methyloceanibacter sp.]